MSSNREVFDYEPVAPSARLRRRGGDAPSTDDGTTAPRSTHKETTDSSDGDGTTPPTAPPASTQEKSASSLLLRRGHGLTYVGLFIFTAFLFIRPYEFISILEPLSEIAFPLGLLTIAIFLPSQLALEGTLTARPREVNLILLLCLTALLSMPLALNRGEAWATFSGIFVKAVAMFIVIVNVARTERRLKWLILIALAAGCILSLGSLNDYRLGNFTVEGYRVKGSLRGWMDNPNDMAIHFVTMIPLAIALLLATRNLIKKMAYAASAVVLTAGIVVTFSRGAFLGLAISGAAFGYKLGRRNRFAVTCFIIFAIISFLILAPANYSDRIISIFDHSRDPNASASMRQAILFQSLYTVLRNPLLGVGMGNFHIVSIKELVSHNAYTQVGAEMGLAALVIYVLFMITPIRGLRYIEHETFEGSRRSTLYYLSVGLQASIIGYMVCSFFASVAYVWYIYYLVGYAVCVRRMYESETGVEVLPAIAAKKRAKAEEKRRKRGLRSAEGESQAAIKV